MSDARQLSQGKLKENFYKAFDASRIMSLLELLGTMAEVDRRRLEGFLGEGTHFQSFALKASPINLAVNVAKAAFTKRGPSEVNRWRAAVGELRFLETSDLVPPLEIVEYAGLIAMIMPQGKAMSRHSEGMRDLNDRLLEISRRLGKRGLVLDDYPQIVECNGQYFINDWSDLKVSSTSYS